MSGGSEAAGMLVVGCPAGGITGPTSPNLYGPTVAGDGWGYEIVTSGENTVAIFPQQELGGIEAARASAVLFAATPDLLEALHLVRMSAGWQYLAMETRSVIEAALAKATPEASAS